jgi:hypothetical protein
VTATARGEVAVRSRLASTSVASWRARVGRRRRGCVRVRRIVPRQLQDRADRRPRLVAPVAARARRRMRRLVQQRPVAQIARRHPTSRARATPPRATRRRRLAPLALRASSRQRRPEHERATTLTIRNHETQLKPGYCNVPVKPAPAPTQRSGYWPEGRARFSQRYGRCVCLKPHDADPYAFAGSATTPPGHVGVGFLKRDRANEPTEVPRPAR